MLGLLAICLITISNISFAATIQSLDKSNVMNIFQDHSFTTIPMITLYGKLENNTFMGYWGKDGKTVGKLANKPDNGPQQDTGTWQVKNNGMLCVTWQNWTNGKETCVNIYQTKNMVIFINADGKFESAALKNSFQTGNQLNTAS